MLRGIKLVQLGLILAIGASLSACHSGSSGSAAAVAYVRLANATQNGSLTLALNQNVTTNNVASNTVTNVTSGVAPNTASAYVAVTAGTYSSTVTDANGLQSSTVAVGLGGTYYTVLVSQRDGAIRQNVIVDDQVAPAGGFASFNAPNFSVDAGALDIYVVPSSVTTLTSAYSPSFGAVNYGSLVNPELLVAGTYNVIVTANGNQNDVRFTYPSLALSGGEMLTLALTGTSGGGLVNGVLVQQGGAVQVVPASTARVRVVSAFAPGSPTSATVGTTNFALASSPSIGSYTLVPANSSISTLSVSGGTPGGALPTNTFAAGGDYTILVYGPPSAWLATVLTDVNQTQGSSAVLRVVNATDTSNAITLTDNGVQKFSGLAYGSVSANYGVTPISGSAVAVTSSGTLLACNICSVVTLESGGIYTYFVLNSPPSVYLSTDR